MWLPWRYALVGAAALAAVGWQRRGPGSLRALCRETALVALLYAMWLRAGEFEPFGIAGGLHRGRVIHDVERSLHLPGEVHLQHWVLPHRWLVEASNLYYAGVHVPAIGVLLVWLWFRHRDRYAVVRTTLAIVTALGLAIRYVPVAPPRLFPEYGFVDTGLLFGQSVYGSFGAGVSAQLAAMPSIHVAWAVLAGAAGWAIGRGRWRWIGPAHAALTVFVVTDTANHWWLDSIVGAGLLVPAFLAARALHSRRRADVRPEPVLVDAAT